jgi:hypothetical protein
MGVGLFTYHDDIFVAQRDDLPAVRDHGYSQAHWLPLPPADWSLSREVVAGQKPTVGSATPGPSPAIIQDATGR